MYLDQHGSVRACCQNTEHPLGNVSEASLREIWEGAQARRLRDAMLEHDLDHGCAFCKWQVAEGNDGLVFARTFDHLRAASTEPTWPKQLELSMSNACNLQCVMCNGDWSSAIRANREGRPPLPQVYDDRFFDDLRPFLEHVEVVKILGGEPFLGRESLRVMEMLVEMGSSAEVHVTTNGTQWSPRIERILERLPMVIIVSLDGVEKAGYESIRIGSDLDVVLANLDRFTVYAAQHGTQVNLAHCLMTSNWRQFPDFLRFADARHLRTYVNTVTYPNSLSLFHLPPARLREIVDHFESIDGQLSSELQLNRAVWKDQLRRLQHRLAGLREGKGVDYYLGVLGFPLVAPGLERGTGAAREYAIEVSAVEPTQLRIDLDHRIREVVHGPGAVLDVSLAELEGKDVESLLGALGQRYGAPSVLSPAVEHPDVRAWRLEFPQGSAPCVSVFLSPIRDEEGVVEEFEAHLATEPVVDEVEASPTTASIEQMAASLRELRPGGDLLVVGPNGRVLEVQAGRSPVSRVLSDVVGLLVDEMFGRLTAAFGDVIDMQNEPSGETMRYLLRFRSSSGVELGIEALQLSMPTDDFGPAGSVVVVSQIP